MIGVRLAHLVHLPVGFAERTEQVFHMVSHLVGDDVGVGEISVSSSWLFICVKKRQVDVASGRLNNRMGLRKPRLRRMSFSRYWWTIPVWAVYCAPSSGTRPSKHPSVPARIVENFASPPLRPGEFLFLLWRCLFLQSCNPPTCWTTSMGFPPMSHVISARTMIPPMPLTPTFEPVLMPRRSLHCCFLCVRLISFSLILDLFSDKILIYLQI